MTLAQFTSLMAMPPLFMMLPARMKNGMASREKELVPMNSLCADVTMAFSNGRISAMARVEERPIPMLMGTPMISRIGTATSMIRPACNAISILDGLLYAGVSLIQRFLDVVDAVENDAYTAESDGGVDDAHGDLKSRIGLSHLTAKRNEPTVDHDTHCENRYDDFTENICCNSHISLELVLNEDDGHMVSLSEHIGCAVHDQPHKEVLGKHFRLRTWIIEKIPCEYLPGNKDRHDAHD